MSHDSFDEQFYQRHYADVAMTGLDPLLHYERYGRLFGRAPNAFQQAKGEASEAAMMDPALLDIQYAHGWARSPEVPRRLERVSVIVPSYNNGQWLARAIHSALSQEGVDAEVLVIDDGSTDNSVAIARRVAETAPSVRVISLLRNFGCYYARNVGLMHATGDYVAVLDSDDIMSPRRILRQLEALERNPGAIACLARARRWTDDFRTAVSDLRHAENTLLWRRDAIRVIGAYDTVRFGGDTEFRERLQAVLGDEAVLRIPDELYFLRTREGSLTSAESGSGAYVLEGGKLTLSLSLERQTYSDNFGAWHRRLRSGTVGEQRLEFPLTSRPFELGSPSQNASPSLGQRRVGAMASFPARKDSLEASIASVLPQLDELILYLNNYDEVPAFATHPKIRATLGRNADGDLRDNGKFFDLPRDDISYVFTLDDDIIYPADYTSKLIYHLETFGRAAVVGFHGVIFPSGEFDDLSQRTVHHFAQAHSGGFVDLLGTGVCAWHSSTLKLSLDDIGTPGLCDLWFALAGARRGVPFYCAPREKGWLKSYATFEDCLFHEARAQPKTYFNIYNRDLAPALDGGKIRRHIEAHLCTAFSPEILSSAGVPLGANQRCPPSSDRMTTGGLSDPIQVIGNVTSERELSPPHFQVVLAGRNQRDKVDYSLRSLAAQRYGRYTYSVTLVDDGSDDGSYQKLSGTSLFPSARLLRIEPQVGVAEAWRFGLASLRDGPGIAVLMEMGEQLESQTLSGLSEQYYLNPREFFVLSDDEC